MSRVRIDSNTYRIVDVVSLDVAGVTVEVRRNKANGGAMVNIGSAGVVQHGGYFRTEDLLELASALQDMA